MLVKSLDAEPGKKVTLFHVVVIRANGADMEILSQAYESREAAAADALRMLGWTQMIQVAVVPSQCNFQEMAIVHDPLKGKPMPLETVTRE